MSLLVDYSTDKLKALMMHLPLWSPLAANQAFNAEPEEGTPDSNHKNKP